MKHQQSGFEDLKVSVRIKLAGLWITLMLLYIYCDIYSFYRTGYVNEMIMGMIGPFEVSQGILVAFGALIAIPVLMIPASLFLNARTVKWTSIVVGVLYTIVNIGNLAGELWAYYWMFGILEILVIACIVLVSARWNREGK